MQVAQAAAGDDDAEPERPADMPPVNEASDQPELPAAPESGEQLADGPRDGDAYGASRILDPFEDLDDLPVPATSGPRRLGPPGVIVCVAGCDRTRDASARPQGSVR